MIKRPFARIPVTGGVLVLKRIAIALTCCLALALTVALAPTVVLRQWGS